MKNFQRNSLSILLILIVPALALWQVSFFANTMKWDIMDQFFPCRYFISECLNHRIFPLWCPYINFGYPFAADPQSGFFYPATWIISILSGYDVYAISTEYIIHIMIAGIAFFSLLNGFKLSRVTSVVFAIVYCLSGIFISNAQHLTWIVSMAWMPLILLSFRNIFEKPHYVEAIKLALFFYLGLTGGYPGLFIILVYFFLFYTGFRFVLAISTSNWFFLKNAFLLFSLAAILAVLLCSGYLYSFIESLPYIARGKPISLIEANNFPLSPRAIISLFFPFATTCSSYSLGTDISMANVYSGFLLVPFLTIAFLKFRLENFEKGLLVFAVVCLMAALGKYFIVRSIIYKVLPGMDMIRHASIFRVFVVFTAVFFSAKGFNWLLNAVRKNEFIKTIQKGSIVYFVLLLTAFVSFLYGNGFHFPFTFSSLSIAEFNTTQNVQSHILAQLAIQLFFLSLLIICFYLKAISVRNKGIIFCGIILLDILIAVQLNLPATVISNVKPAVLQAKLNTMPKDFPVPTLIAEEQFTHFSDGSTLPIWYNISFFTKIPAKDGFNSFYLQGVDDFYNSANASNVLKKSVVSFSDSAVKFQIEKFNPGEVVVSYQAGKNSELMLLQSFYKGWKAVVDGKEVVIYKGENNFISFNAEQGNHQVKFVYDKPVVRFMFFFSLILLLFLIGIIAFKRRFEFINS
jgi:hypothetical protein